jgi:hypothetical protein
MSKPLCFCAIQHKNTGALHKISEKAPPSKAAIGYRLSVVYNRLSKEVVYNRLSKKMATVENCSLADRMDRVYEKN